MNKHTNIIFLGLAFLVVCGIGRRASAQELMPADFAYGIRIDTVGQHPVQAFVLPRTVYEHLTRDDLGDLRIFNSKGTALPHALHQAAEMPAVEPPALSPVPFFPIYGSSKKTIGELEVQVQRTRDGSLVRITENAQDRQQVLRGFIVDASDIDVSIDRLIVDWKESPDNVMAKVFVESSNNLAQWQSWGSGTLTSMRHKEDVLERNMIDLSPRRAKYYRLSWSAQSNIPAVDTIYGRAVQVQLQVDRQWADISLEKDESGTYAATIPGTIPADRVEISLPEAQTIVRVQVESAASSEGPWTNRYSGLAYNLQAGEDQWRSAPISVYRNTHRHWRMEVNEEASGVLLGSPSLRFGWVPARVLFVPQGPAPYTIAFGNAEAEPAGFSSNELFRPVANNYSGVFDLPTASLSAIEELGGEERLKAPTEVPWEQLVLWGTMILGVVVLGALALRLMQQNEEAGGEEEGSKQ